jgi:glycosyltransferase involved in cell wall biosynthesis
MNKVIYTSSYDRGLEHLLRIWPDVLKEVPSVTLDIYYGWKLFDKFYRNNPGMMAWKARMNKLMDHPSITDHGRVSQDEIENKMKSSHVWAYPTHFDEISCITAMKAQVFGCIPVVINKAALKETVQYGVKVEGDIFDPKVKKEYTKQLIKVLNGDHNVDVTEMKKWAKNKYKWSSVAKQWGDEFKS